MKKSEQHTKSEADPPQPLPYPDSDWLPGLQKTIQQKLEKGELDEVDADVFHGMMGQISREKEDEK